MTLSKKREIQIQHIKHELDNGYFPVVYALELQCTYGLPVEITNELAKQHGFKNGVNLAEFNKYMEVHKVRSKVSAKRLFCH